MLRFLLLQTFDWSDDIAEKLSSARSSRPPRRRKSDTMTHQILKELQGLNPLLVVLLVALAVLATGAHLARRRLRRPSADDDASRLDAAASALRAQISAYWRAEANARVLDHPIQIAFHAIRTDGVVARDRGRLALTRGEDADLYRFYEALSPPRMVIVGGPGAGKSGALILLLLASLEAGASDPSPLTRQVPVLLTVGDWDPTRQSLRAWVSETMYRDHPYLRASAYGREIVERLFEARHLALFLDGFDEMPAETRANALKALSREPSAAIVLTSRPAEYRGVAPP